MPAPLPLMSAACLDASGSGATGAGPNIHPCATYRRSPQISPDGSGKSRGGQWQPHDTSAVVTIAGKAAATSCPELRGLLRVCPSGVHQLPGAPEQHPQPCRAQQPPSCSRLPHHPGVHVVNAQVGVVQKAAAQAVPPAVPAMADDGHAPILQGATMLTYGVLPIFGVGGLRGGTGGGSAGLSATGSGSSRSSTT